MVIVPNAVVQRLNNMPVSKIRKKRALNMYGYVLRKLLFESIPFDEPVDISYNHFITNFGSSYIHDLSLLRNASLIDSDDQYYYHTSTDVKGQCKQWTLNPDYVYSDPLLLELDKRKPKFQRIDVVKESVKLISKLRLAIDKRNMSKEALSAAIRTVDGERIFLNGDIPSARYRLSGSRKTYGREHLLDMTGKNDLILYRGKCYIDRYCDFREKKITELHYKYLLQLGTLKGIRNRQNIVCSRNETNYRLDTNITQTKSTFLTKLYLGNSRLVSIDLKNSQFLFFHHHLYNKSLCNYNVGDNYHPYIPLNVYEFLEKMGENKYIIDWESDSYRGFEKCAKTGGFYEMMGEALYKSSGVRWERPDVKRSMFTVLFAGYRYNGQDKRAVRAAFPGLVRVADEFKKLYGDNQLAIYLQTVESKLFIDGILSKLLSQGLRVFSKHDAIVCRELDLPQVRGFVEGELSGYFGEGNYALETSFAGE